MKGLDWLDLLRSEGVQSPLYHQVHLSVRLEVGKEKACLGKLELHELPSKAVQTQP
jgi:hypothetical protein